jgi:hypothetical protein
LATLLARLCDVSKVLRRQQDKVRGVSMMKYDLDYPLPATAIELLLALVDTAKQYQIQIIPCREVRVLKDFGFEEKDPLGTLQKIGLVERLGQHDVRLQAVAFERAKYERKNRLGKWLQVAVSRLRLDKGVVL